MFYKREKASRSLVRAFVTIWPRSVASVKFQTAIRWCCNTFPSEILVICFFESWILKKPDGFTWISWNDHPRTAVIVCNRVISRPWRRQTECRFSLRRARFPVWTFLNQELLLCTTTVLQSSIDGGANVRGHISADPFHSIHHQYVLHQPKQLLPSR